jgi:hypothetical protein
MKETDKSIKKEKSNTNYTDKDKINEGLCCIWVDCIIFFYSLISV